jgi:hypothetical protein
MEAPFSGENGAHANKQECIERRYPPELRERAVQMVAEAFCTSLRDKISLDSTSSLVDIWATESEAYVSATPSDFAARASPAPPRLAGAPVNVELK